MMTNLKTNIYLSILLIIAIALASIFYFQSVEHKYAKDRLELNYQIAQKDLIYFKTKNDELAVKSDIQEWTIRELNRGINRNLLKEIENLGVKLNKLVNYSSSVIYYDKVIFTTLKDSIVNDTIQIKTFNYLDEFYSINATIYNDSLVKQSIHSKDSIIQVVFHGERINKNNKIMPNWWVFTPRRLQQKMVCKNPSASIEYSKTISIIKK